MLRQPVAVVPLSLSRSPSLRVSSYAFSIFLLVGLCFGAEAQVLETTAAPYQIPLDSAQRYLGRIGYDNPDQISEALDRVEAFYQQSEVLLEPDEPIAIVVHGPEVSVFEQTNYEQYKTIVDKAARLTALGAVDIVVCETRMDHEGIEASSIYPFVGTVPFGPQEIDSLLTEQDYIYF